MEYLRLCGILNTGNTCYVNTVLQCFKSIDNFENICVNTYFNINNNETLKPKTETIIYDMGHCYNLMTTHIGKTLKPSGLIRKIDTYIKSINPDFNINTQGDIHEVFTYLIEKLLNELGTNCISTDKNRQILIGNLIKYREQHNLVNKKYASYEKECMDKWLNEFGSRYSPLVELIFRQDIKSIICSNPECKSRSISYDNSSELELDLPYSENMNEISIYELINSYFETSYLNSGTNDNIEWKCERCNQKSHNCKKRRYIYKYPQILVINLKRFAFIPNKGFIKNHISINLENDILDFNKINNIKLDYKYQLRSMGMHQGALNRGHYYTIVKDYKKKNSYYLLNDEQILQVPKYNKHDSYILLYELLPNE